jgi:hypothetical protein
MLNCLLDNRQRPGGKAAGLDTNGAVLNHLRRSARRRVLGPADSRWFVPVGGRVRGGVRGCLLGRDAHLASIGDFIVNDIWNVRFATCYPTHAHTETRFFANRGARLNNTNNVGSCRWRVHPRAGWGRGTEYHRPI